jgi:hypothetical protein
MNEHYEFYLYVQSYIEKNPECGAYVSDFVAKGIEKARKQANERAADMEVALSVALAKRFKNGNEVILSKLEKWNPRSSLKWDSTIELLRKAQEKC